MKKNEKSSWNDLKYQPTAKKEKHDFLAMHTKEKNLFVFNGF